LQKEKTEKVCKNFKRKGEVGGHKMKSSTPSKERKAWDIGVTNVFHMVHTSHQVANDSF
jgi:hypothetical protein